MDALSSRPVCMSSVHCFGALWWLGGSSVYSGHNNIKYYRQRVRTTNNNNNHYRFRCFDERATEKMSVQCIMRYGCTPEDILRCIVLHDGGNNWLCSRRLRVYSLRRHRASRRPHNNIHIIRPRLPLG